MMLPINANRCFNSDSIFIESPTFSEFTPNSLQKMPYYVCRVTQLGYNPIVGLINLINYQDFHSRIIPHEQVYKDKVNNYIHQFITGNILNNPILLFYKNFSEFQRLVRNLIHSLDQVNIQHINGITYEIFAVTDCEIVKKLQSYLDKIPKFYIADGHHRVYALSEIRTQSAATFSQYYISFVVQENDLQLGSFDRFIKGIDLDTEHFMQQLEQKYIIKKVPKEALNCEVNVYIHINDVWYQLDLKKQALFSKFNQVPFVHTDKFIISLLTTRFPLTSKVLFSPSTNRVDDILHFYKKNQCQAAITIPRTSLHELFNIVGKDYMLPPHSTCFTPKIPNDLFIQKINFATS